MTRREWSLVAVAVLIGCCPLRSWADGAPDDADAADDGCILTTANIDIAKNKYLHNREFRSVAWDDKTNTAHVVTRSGEALTIQHWACENLAVEGILTLRIQPGVSSKHLREKLLWLGGQILLPEDVAVLKRAFGGQEFRAWSRNAPLDLNLRGAFYSWLNIEITVETSTAVMKLFGTQ